MPAITSLQEGGSAGIRQSCPHCLKGITEVVASGLSWTEYDVVDAAVDLMGTPATPRPRLKVFRRRSQLCGYRRGIEAARRGTHHHLNSGA